VKYLPALITFKFSKKSDGKFIIDFKIQDKKKKLNKG